MALQRNRSGRRQCDGRPPRQDRFVSRGKRIPPSTASCRRPAQREPETASRLWPPPGQGGSPGRHDRGGSPNARSIGHKLFRHGSLLRMVESSATAQLRFDVADGDNPSSGCHRSGSPHLGHCPGRLAQYRPNCLVTHAEFAGQRPERGPVHGGPLNGFAILSRELPRSRSLIRLSLGLPH
jgi:hypothetical protein